LFLDGDAPVNSRILLPLTAAVVLLYPSASPAQLKAPNGAKVLLLSGGQRQHHGYRRQANLLQKVLETTKQFEVMK
jgi:hypothetical protein